VDGTRLYYAHAETLEGPRTLVLLGDQQHLTFVADLPEHVPAAALRAVMLNQLGLYPHLVDRQPARTLPRPVDVPPRPA
jgi:hypothetical protein